MISLFKIALEGSILHHNVYVVELDPAVLKEHKFLKRNPNYDLGSKKSCYYVGSTGLTPQQRYDKHKQGIKSNVYVERYGIRLATELYEKYNPMTFNDAVIKEKELAEELRNIGFCVWSA